MKKISICFVLIGLFISAQAQFVNRTNPYGFEGNVSAMAHTTDHIYVGGSFTGYGKNCFRGVLLTSSNDQVSANSPLNFNNTINVSVSDGSGGYYIGGSFTSVNGVTRNRLAHLLADGSLDATWNPNAGGAVYAIAISGSDV